MARLVPRELADEFNVGIRTIQRDLTERLSFLDLEKDQRGLQPAHRNLGKWALTTCSGLPAWPV